MDTKIFTIVGCIVLFVGISCSRKERQQLEMPNNVSILEFSFAGQKATITKDTITLVVPRGTDLAHVAPTIVISEGARVVPESGVEVNFTQHPIHYHVFLGNLYQDYCVRVYCADIPTPRQHGRKIGYINWEDTEKTQGQELAWQWLQTAFPDSVDLLSLWDIQHRWIDMDQYAVIWYHTRGVEGNGTLPFRAYDPDLVEQMKAYTNSGGKLLLTAMAPRWMETLGLSAYVPNNFYGHESAYTNQNIGFTPRQHPVFNGIETDITGQILLMDANKTIENNTSAWYLAAWGGYNNSVDQWEQTTSGKALATDFVDGGTAMRVVMAEFMPTSMQLCHYMTINSGYYDWSITDNAYLSNIQKLTSNVLNYLRDAQ